MRARSSAERRHSGPTAGHNLAERREAVAARHHIGERREAVASAPGAGAEERTAVATAVPRSDERRAGVDIGMLVVAALAAVAAAVVTSELWPGGTLISTAMTPVIVTLVKEWLRKPAERISAVSAKAPDLAARVVAPVRGAGDRTESLRVRPRTARIAEQEPPVLRTPEGPEVVVPPAGSPAAETPPEETFVEPAPGASTRFRLYRRRSPRWRLAAITGVLAFVIAALAITLPELVFGGAVAGKGSTTVFGGGSSQRSSAKSAKPSSGERSGHRGAMSQRESKAEPKSTPAPASKGGQPSTGSSPSPSQNSTQQAPSATGPPSQTSSSTPAPSSPGQTSSGSGSRSGTGGQ